MMEVPGKKSTLDQETASAEYSSVSCQPCENSGKTVAAKSFCEDCQETLCSSCSDYHRTLKVLKHHKLLDVSDSAKPTRVKQGSKPTVSCRVHVDKLVEFYCQKHNVTACGTCAVLDHATCKPEFIPDISLGYKDSDKYRGLKGELDTLLNNDSVFLDRVKENIQSTSQNGRDIITKVKKYREEINAYLLKKEKELIAEVEEMQNKDIRNLKQVKDNLEKTKSELRDMKTRLTSVEKQSSDLFIECTNFGIRLQDLQDVIARDGEKIKASSYIFTKSQTLKDFVSSNEALGNVSRIPITETATASVATEMKSDKGDMTSQVITKTDWKKCHTQQQSDINIKHTNDKENCRISGMTYLSPSILLLTDYYNQCIKRVDCSTSSITSYLQLSSGPLDITTLGPDQAAVTLPYEQKIQFICTKPDLSLVRTIKVNGCCLGIDSTVDNKLIVSYTVPSKMEMMDDQGTVLHTLGTDVHSQPLFTNPWYVCVVSEDSQEVIYVSDRDTSTITKLSMTGQVLLTYTDEDLKCPTGLVATGDGHILVCGQWSHNVQVVSQSGKKIRTLLCNTDGIQYPWSVCYDSRKKTVFVGRENEVKVYMVQ